MVRGKTFTLLETEDWKGKTATHFPRFVFIDSLAQHIRILHQRTENLKYFINPPIHFIYIFRNSFFSLDVHILAALI